MYARSSATAYRAGTRSDATVDSLHVIAVDAIPIIAPRLDQTLRLDLVEVLLGRVVSTVQTACRCGDHWPYAAVDTAGYVTSTIASNRAPASSAAFMATDPPID